MFDIFPQNVIEKFSFSLELFVEAQLQRIIRYPEKKTVVTDCGV